MDKYPSFMETEVVDVRPPSLKTSWREARVLFDRSISRYGVGPVALLPPPCEIDVCTGTHSLMDTEVCYVSRLVEKVSQGWHMNLC